MPGLYIHIPFCRRKCIYCDFYSVGERFLGRDSFVEAVCNEFRYQTASVGSSYKFDTIYIGGGTPSLLQEREISLLCREIRPFIKTDAEFTMEVNPDDVTPEMVNMWKNNGVNRISMGVQSMVDAELRFIGRRHDADTVVKALGNLREQFDNISIDLMFGLPCQTLESLDFSMSQVIKLNPEHVSAYSLMYEERTAITRMLYDGTVDPQHEEDSSAMFDLVCTRLKEAGYSQYEISNFAKPGFRSRHNGKYWTGESYLGLGPAAHSYDGVRTRHQNLPDIKGYVDFWKNEGTGELRPEDIPQTVRQSENLTDDELREEMIMTRLRTIEGLDIEEFKFRFGNKPYCELLGKIEKFIRSGHAQFSEDVVCGKRYLRLTHRGFYISDEIMSSLF